MKAKTTQNLKTHFLFPQIDRAERPQENSFPLLHSSGGLTTHLCMCSFTKRLLHSLLSSPVTGPILLSSPHCMVSPKMFNHKGEKGVKERRILLCYHPGLSVGKWRQCVSCISKGATNNWKLAFAFIPCWKMHCDFNKEVCWIPKNKTKYTLWNTKYRANIKYLNSSVFPYFLLTGVGICTQAKQMFVNW